MGQNGSSAGFWIRNVSLGCSPLHHFVFPWHEFFSHIARLKLSRMIFHFYLLSVVLEHPLDLSLCSLLTLKRRRYSPSCPYSRSLNSLTNAFTRIRQQNSHKFVSVLIFKVLRLPNAPRTNKRRPTLALANGYIPNTNVKVTPHVGGVFVVFVCNAPCYDF